MSAPGSVIADRIACAVMALGVALMLQPWWPAGLRWGFLLALLGTIAQIITGHLCADKERP